MRDWIGDCLDAILTDVNALGIYRPLQTSTTHTDGKYILHPIGLLTGVALTLGETDEPRTILSKIAQAAPIPDTRNLIWTECNVDPSMRQLAIESDIDPTLGLDAVHVKYAFFHEGSWVYLHRFIVLDQFISPRELLSMLKTMIPDFSAEEAARKRNTRS